MKLTARRWYWIGLLLVLVAPLLQAATVKAFLDRSQVPLGDTVTLNIQAQASVGQIDLAPLQNDFQVLGTSRSSSVDFVNGKVSRTTQIGIALKPLRTGTLTIPALQVGGGSTQPLSVTVTAATAGNSGKPGAPVFMQDSVLATTPYVGQQTVYTARLFYLPGVDGASSDPTADGAQLVKLDRDQHYTVNRNGYVYQVLERSWAVIPQRAGPITIHGPQFQGQNLSANNVGQLFNNPNSWLNRPGATPFSALAQPVQAVAPDVQITARAVPAGAGKPWLPARDVTLKLTGLPANGTLDGSAPLTLTLTVSATGMPASALPEPTLPPIAGASVYPDQTQDATDARGEWLQGARTRSFAVVPARNGTVSIPAISLDWWNVATDRAEQATVPAHSITVTGVVAGAATASAGVPQARASAPAAAPSVGHGVPARGADTHVGGGWKIAAILGMALWAVTLLAALAWWWWRRATQRSTPIAQAAPSAVADRAGVLQRQALDGAARGDVVACERALLAWARCVRPQLANLGSLRATLADAAQRDAVSALQQARWQEGDATAACAMVGRAFAHGFAWREEPMTKPGDDGGLPPLYPTRD